MSPEQLRNFRDVRPQSDVYAVGMTAYSLLSGRLALNIGRSTNMAETIKAIFEQPTIPLRQQAPHLPEAVCEIIDRALVKLSLIHISEPTRLLSISYAVF